VRARVCENRQSDPWILAVGGSKCHVRCRSPWTQEKRDNKLVHILETKSGRLLYSLESNRSYTPRPIAISKMHVISKCQFGLLTGMRSLLTGSTWQKFLSTGPHPVYRLKPYRYRTESFQQATSTC
jgi:hypothetical protein